MKLPQMYDELTPAQRKVARLAYVEQQEGRCWYCLHSLDHGPSPEVIATPLDMRLFPPGFLRWPIHLHHSHKSGLTIGAVHARCNGVLFQYEGE